MESAQLVDKRPAPLLRVGLELGELLRVLEQRDDAERNHVHHSSVASDEEEEGDLHRLGLVEVAGLDLFDGELGDDVVLGGGEALVDERGHVVEEAPGKRGVSGDNGVGGYGDEYWLAAEASRAVALPLVRMAFP